MKFLLSFLITMTVLSSCGNTSGGTDPFTTLNLHLAENPVTLNVVSDLDAFASDVNDYLYDGLLSVDSNLNIKPNIATNWYWQTNRVNGSNIYVLTYQLRGGVKWHDGQPCTAHDFVFTFEKIMDPKSRALNKISSFEGYVIKAEAPDDHTVKVTYNQPLAMALIDFGGLLPLPRHLYQGKDFDRSPYNTAPIGNGPYRFKQWAQRMFITLERNEDYWQTRPWFRYIRFRIMPDENTAFAGFRKGDIDIYEMLVPQYWDEKDKPYLTNLYNIYQYTYYRSGFSHITWNCTTNSFFSDSRVRRAMTMCLDRESIRTNYFHGLVRLVSGPFYPGAPEYNKDVPLIGYDPEEARKMLAEAGYKDTDGDGVLDRNGRAFRFELILGDTPTGKTYALNLKENLARIGVDMTLRVIDWSAMDKMLKDRKFDAALFSWALGFDPNPYDLLHSGRISNGLNFGEFVNPAADRLMESAKTDLDPKRRLATLRKLHALLAEEQPMSFIASRLYITAVEKRIKNVVPTAAGIKNYNPGYTIWSR